MGDYDIPASIEYILELTGSPKLAYVGHSMGTTQLFYALIRNNDYYKERISIFIAMAPPIECNHVTSPAALFLT